MSSNGAAEGIRHLACIMDGNRRWARKQTATNLYTHDSAQAVFEVVAACKKHSIPYLSLYAFSLENDGGRDDELKQHLFAALIDACINRQHTFIEQGVKVVFVGLRERYPAAVLAAIESLESATASQTGLHLSVLFYYGGRQEIVAAAQAIVQAVAAGALMPEAVNATVFESYLLTGPVPPPDVIIRTGGAQRLSNFLLYQAAYSELLFLDCLWPEVTTATIERCLQQFRAIERNFGK